MGRHHGNQCAILLLPGFGRIKFSNRYSKTLPGKDPSRDIAFRAARLRKIHVAEWGHSRCGCRKSLVSNSWKIRPRNVPTIGTNATTSMSPLDPEISDRLDIRSLKDTVCPWYRFGKPKHSPGGLTTCAIYKAGHGFRLELNDWLSDFLATQNPSEKGCSRDIYEKEANHEKNQNISIRCGRASSYT